VAVNTQKSLTVMVLQAPFGFGWQLVDSGGRVVATARTPRPVSRRHTNVLLLSDMVDADVRLEALPQLLAPGLDVTQLRTARDFPDVALHLAGLDAVVIDDFDTAALTARQRRALQDYVSLGGSLVLTGGAAWSRTLASLPPGLAPLRVSAGAPASLGPLADLLGATTTADAEVATGDLTGGRVVVAAPAGPALVVVSDYRAGRVVQLTFDPLAEPIASEPLLSGVAWDQALGRVTSRWGPLLTSQPEPIAEDQLWAPLLGAPPWPSWPAWEVGLLVVYALVVVPTAVWASRRARFAAGRAIIVVVVVLSGGACLSLARPLGRPTESVIEIRKPGADGTVLTTSYRGLLARGRPETVVVPTGATSTVFSAQPVFGAVRSEGDPHLTGIAPSVPGRPQPLIARGVGGGAVLSGGNRPGVRLAAGVRELRTVQTVSVGQRGPGLEATLRLKGTSAILPARVVGTVTNSGSVAIRHLRAQVQSPPPVHTMMGAGGQARLADVLAPGETRQIDAPIEAGIGIAPGSGLVPREERVMYAAASREFTGPNQVAIVGLTDPVTRHEGTGADRRRVTVVVSVVRAEAAEAIRAGSGGARLIAASPRVGGKFGVSELEAPPGAGPLSIRYNLGTVVDGRPPQSYEIYNWTTGTWRALPASSDSGYGYVLAPLEQAEVDSGLVRFRVRSEGLDDPLFLAAGAELRVGSGPAATPG